MADVKNLLKEARKFIDENKFNEAQECCKNILRKDKQNYLALVLLGKSLQDSEQAPLAFQKAISTKPDHPLGWQGLANYYERKEVVAEKTKLIGIYKEMLNLQIEEDKALETVTKLGQLGCTLKSNECITILLQYSIKTESKLKETAEKQVLDLLKNDITCKTEDVETIVDLLQKIYNAEPSDKIELLIAKVVIQKNDYASAISEIIGLKFFSNNVVLKEWLCKHLCNNYIENNSFCNIDIENIVDQVTDGIENSKYPALLKSMICYEKKLYFDAYKKCVPLINYQQADVTEATFIINCTMMLRKWPVTQKLSTNFLNSVKDNNFAVILKKYLFISLAKQKKWKQAIGIAQEIPLQVLNNKEKLTFGECCIEENASVNNILAQLEGTDEHIELQALLLLKQGKYEDTLNLLSNSKESSTTLFYISKAQWELKQYDKCLIHLLKTAKSNPEHSDTFLYLGHYYRYCKDDLEKAKKCYEKSYNLNSIDNDIAKNLSEVYSKLNLKEADFELLTKAEKDVQTSETWISFRLGLHYLNKREWENAIVKFRNVIKSNQSDVTAFECLADAYYSRGSFTSALRAYNKVMILNSKKAPHCLTRIGYIYSLLTQYDEAITTFEKVFTLEPYSLLALKGIAETWVRVAKTKLLAKLYGAARDCIQHSIDYIRKSFTKNKQFSCMWKLLGDALMFITKLPNNYAYVFMQKSFTDSNEEISKLEKLDIFPQAIACYSRVAKQKSLVTSYDLASAYLAYYCETKDVVNSRISYNLIVRCIKENPSAWRNWNLLGKVCLFIKKYDLAQHCFIKALLVTRKWSVAKIWCNLGTLYVKLKLYKLANYCFWRGQCTLPSYPQSWIGQGLIAEVIREEEAMDLFRHASRLGYHPESALGYADWVCRTLKNDNYKTNPEFKYEIDGLYAIPYSIDLVEWYCSYKPNDACAWTILGILQERSGLLMPAFKSYEKAFMYASEDKKNIALLNIGRIFIRMEKYDEAIKIYKAITEASLNSTCGLALALFKKGLHEEAYSAYDTALHWLSNEDAEKADLLVAMAGIVYMFKGADDAKTLLFHSIQISQNKPTAYSLFAICALGLIHSDQSLSKLAVSELRKHEKNSEYSFDIGFLKSYLLVREENMGNAIKLLSDSLHDHPSNALLWFCMAQYCLKASSTKAKVASRCAQKALCSAHYGEGNYDSPKMLATASIAELIAGNPFKALLLAKEGLHLYPSHADVWAALLFSLQSHDLWAERSDWILSAASHMRRHLDISRSLSRWAGFLEKKLKK